MAARNTCSSANPWRGKEFLGKAVLVCAKNSEPGKALFCALARLEMDPTYQFNPPKYHRIYGLAYIRHLLSAGKRS